MKRLILFELLLIFLATTFESDSPPGWFQQTLPRTDVTIQDIFFTDSLNGWAVAQRNPGSDTSFIFYTSDGGNNWVIQHQEKVILSAMNFVDNNTGYCVGTRISPSGGIVKKTTNGGANWLTVSQPAAGLFRDVQFVNKDTGWLCSGDSFGGGIAKTTNGGVNWVLQAGDTTFPLKLSFINKDTGWVCSTGPNGRLFRTTNGGINWITIHVSSTQIQSLFFLNGLNGWIRAGTSNSSIQYTTNSGFNWSDAQGDIIGGFNTQFMNDSVGYSGTFTGFRILKSTNGGKLWGYQNTPLISGNQLAVLRYDTLNAWASQIMHTSDGGGQMILGLQQLGNEIPSDYKLYQNYPNPFNPSTNIKYQIINSKNVKLIIYNIQGKEITTLINEEQSAGIYQADWNASGMPSGVYFYSLIVDGIIKGTRKMILIK